MRLRALAVRCGKFLLGMGACLPQLAAKHATEAHGLVGRAMDLVLRIGIWVVIVYLVYMVVPLTIWMVRPGWMFRFAMLMRNVSVFGLDKKFNTALLYASFVKPYEYSRRVLDAWVQARLPYIRNGFQLLESVGKHTKYVPAPLKCDGQSVDQLTPEVLHTLFRNNAALLLITGDGGCGKTSLACQLALRAMEMNGPQFRPMIPIFLDRTFEPDKDGKKSLDETAHGQLTSLLKVAGGDDSVSDELFNNLVRKGRILLIVDRLSEMDEDTRKSVRPMSKDFAARVLIITSRENEQELLGGVAKRVLKPELLKKDDVNGFLDRYLQAAGARSRLSDQEFELVVKGFWQLAGNQESITPLLLTAYADWIVKRLENAAQREPAPFANDIPGLMESYAIEMHRSKPEEYREREREVLWWLKAAGWECVKEAYSPRPVPIENLIRAIKRADLELQSKEKEKEQIQMIDTKTAKSYIGHLVKMGALRTVDNGASAEFA